MSSSTLPEARVAFICNGIGATGGGVFLMPMTGAISPLTVSLAWLDTSSAGDLIIHFVTVHAKVVPSDVAREIVAISAVVGNRQDR